MRYLSTQYQIVIFSRETTEDSWFEKKGGQVAGSDEQTNVIKKLFSEHNEIKLDGLYSSIVSHRAQNMFDDYS